MGLMLDRGEVNSLAHLRSPEGIAELLSRKTTRIRIFPISDRGEVATVQSDDAVALWSIDPEYLEGKWDRLWLMGATSDGVVHLALPLSDSECKQFINSTTAPQFAAITEVGFLLSDDDTRLGVQATALAQWHAAAPFCSRCGARLQGREAGWARECRSCSLIEYPRTDPAVIVAVTDQDERLLLAHNNLWPDRRMSLLAGFVEAGESPERTVSRELREEVGISVENITYIGAQPWPRPRSLMLCFEATITSDSGPLSPDGTEIDVANFYTRRHFAKAAAEGEIILPGPTAVAHAMIRRWFGDNLPRPQSALQWDARADQK